MKIFNSYQIITKDNYSKGTYEHVTSIDEIESLGDTLFSTIMSELSTYSGCKNFQIAIARIRKVKGEVDSVLQALIAVDKNNISSSIKQAKNLGFEVYPDSDQRSMFYYVDPDGEYSDISYDGEREAWNYIVSLLHPNEPEQCLR